MEKIREAIRDTSGSSMILALVFLLFCLFVGSSVLVAASANAGRWTEEFQTEQDQRSGLILLKDLLADGLQITVRDVSIVQKSGEIKETIRCFASGGEWKLEDLLYSWAVNDYEQELGVLVDACYKNGKVWTRRTAYPDMAGEIRLQLDSQILEEPREITGSYRFLEDGTLEIRIDGPADLRLILPAGESADSFHQIAANGISTTTRTRVYYWEPAVIEKGENDDETS